MNMRDRRQAKKRKAERRASHKIAGEALRAAGDVGSIAELANPEDTGEMRVVLSRLLQTEETLANIAKKYITK